MRLSAWNSAFAPTFCGLEPFTPEMSPSATRSPLRAASARAWKTRFFIGRRQSACLWAGIAYQLVQYRCAQHRGPNIIQQARPNLNLTMLERFFRLSENHTTVRIELLAGLTTFLTMAYIIVVQPAVLSGAMFGMN